MFPQNSDFFTLTFPCSGRSYWNSLGFCMINLQNPNQWWRTKNWCGVKCFEDRQKPLYGSVKGIDFGLGFFSIGNIWKFSPIFFLILPIFLTACSWVFIWIRIFTTIILVISCDRYYIWLFALKYLCIVVFCIHLFKIYIDL